MRCYFYQDDQKLRYDVSILLLEEVFLKTYCSYCHSPPNNAMLTLDAPSAGNGATETAAGGN